MGPVAKAVACSGLYVYVYAFPISMGKAFPISMGKASPGGEQVITFHDSRWQKALHLLLCLSERYENRVDVQCVGQDRLQHNCRGIGVDGVY